MKRLDLLAFFPMAFGLLVNISFNKLPQPILLTKHLPKYLAYPASLKANKNNKHLNWSNKPNKKTNNQQPFTKHPQWDKHLGHVFLPVDALCLYVLQIGCHKYKYAHAYDSKYNEQSSSNLFVLQQESERDTNTRWSPVMEIRYRGGVYNGRCQGGLPEGRVRNFWLNSVLIQLWTRAY